MAAVNEVIVSRRPRRSQRHHTQCEHATTPNPLLIELDSIGKREASIVMSEHELRYDDEARNPEDIPPVSM